VFLETYVQAVASLAYIRQITCVTCQLVDSPFTVDWVWLSLGGLIRLAMVLRHLYAILMFEFLNMFLTLLICGEIYVNVAHFLFLLSCGVVCFVLCSF